jgi:hypothetical protein
VASPSSIVQSEDSATWSLAEWPSPSSDNDDGEITAVDDMPPPRPAPTPPVVLRTGFEAALDHMKVGIGGVDALLSDLVMSPGPLGTSALEVILQRQCPDASSGRLCDRVSALRRYRNDLQRRACRGCRGRAAFSRSCTWNTHAFKEPLHVIARKVDKRIAKLRRSRCELDARPPHRAPPRAMFSFLGLPLPPRWSDFA